MTPGAPGEAARGGHLARGHHHLGDPRAGEPRRTRGHAGGAGGGQDRARELAAQAD
ncbi:hypothetical protein V2I01_02560 [Micromonospora sp. BRA006-A]|nr:hypothetical protein [Micromonospora sp. BRA006-A]